MLQLTLLIKNFSTSVLANSDVIARSRGVNLTFFLLTFFFLFCEWTKNLFSKKMDRSVLVPVDSTYCGIPLQSSTNVWCKVLARFNIMEITHFHTPDCDEDNHLHCAENEFERNGCLVL